MQVLGKKVRVSRYYLLWMIAMVIVYVVLFSIAATRESWTGVNWVGGYLGFYREILDLHDVANSTEGKIELSAAIILSGTALGLIFGWIFRKVLRLIRDVRANRR